MGRDVWSDRYCMKSHIDKECRLILPKAVRESWVADGFAYLVPETVSGGLRLLTKVYIETRLDAARSENILMEMFQVLAKNMVRIAIDQGGRFEIPLQMLKFAKIVSCVTLEPIEHGLLIRADSA